MQKQNCRIIITFLHVSYSVNEYKSITTHHQLPLIIYYRFRLAHKYWPLFRCWWGHRAIRYRWWSYNSRRKWWWRTIWPPPSSQVRMFWVCLVIPEIAARVNEPKSYISSVNVSRVWTHVIIQMKNIKHCSFMSYICWQHWHSCHIRIVC